MTERGRNHAANRGRKVRPAAPVLFRAGCRREWLLESAEADLAYTEQAFSDCPDCVHRVEPQDGPPFCTLRPASTPHPFAALAALSVPDNVPE